MRRILLFIALLTSCLVVAPLNAQGVPSDLEPITPENVAQVEQVGQLGRGWVQGVDWFSNTHLLVDADVLWVFDVTNLTAPPRNPLPSEMEHELEHGLPTLYLEEYANEYRVLSNATSEIRLVLDVVPLLDSFTVSNDGTLIAYAAGDDRDNTVYVVNVGTEQERASFKAGGAVRYLAFSPDNTQLAVTTAWNMYRGEYEGYTGLRLWDIASGTPVIEVEQGGFHPFFWKPEYSPDGTWLAAGDVRGDLAVWNAETGETIEYLPSPAFTDYVQVSDDGQFLASRDHSGWQLWHLPTGAQYSFVQGDSDGVIDFDFGAREVGDDVQGFWNVDHGRLLRSEPLDNPAVAVVLGNDLWIRREPYTDTLFHYYLYSDRTMDIAQLMDGANLIFAASDDGTRLAITERYPNLVSIWDISDLSSVTVLPNWTLPYAPNSDEAYLYGGYVNVMAFSPDGRLLAVARDWSIELYDVETAELLKTLEGHREAIEALAFSPDGTLVASAGSGENGGAFEQVTQEAKIHLWGIPNS